MTGSSAYIPRTIEARWQRRWEEGGTFQAQPRAGEKFYCYNPAPYVTGALHMGHVRNYTYGDFLSKFKRLHGANVLYTIGFDAFGVPTEVAAMRKRLDPAAWTASCVEEMKKQLVRMGFGLDWRRSFSTAEPDYYRWTQWIFIEMFRDGLVYEREAETLWCPQCEMALARSLTVDGNCFLCDVPVETRVTRQWFLRITSYLDRLRRDLVEVKDLNGQAQAGQESLLAFRSLWGVGLIEPSTGRKILACMETPAHWSTHLVLAIHPQDWPNRRALAEGGAVPSPETGGVKRVVEPIAERLFTVVEPVSGRPVAVVEPVSGRTFAVVVDPTLDTLYLDQPVLKPVPPPAGAPPPEAAPVDVIVPLMVNEQKDFSISRQRLWGTPIPMVRCEACGSAPVDTADLPVMLPRIEADHRGRLRRAEPDWDARPCPSCRRPARLDPQVMDCHFDALWHYCRPCVVSTAEFPFGTEEARYWMPVDQIQFGRDTIPFLLTLRLFTKFLKDRGLSDVNEFAREMLAHGLILKDNRKMSKHIGNVVDPEEMIARHGADSLRFYVLARNEPKSDYGWSDASLERYHELLEQYCEDLDPAGWGETAGEESATKGAGPGSGGNEPVSPAPVETSAARPPAGSAGKYILIFLTKVLHEVEVLESSVASGRFDIYARAVARILEALRLFKGRYHAQAGSWGRETWARCAELSILYLAPIAPHLAEECWERHGRSPRIFEGARWPSDGPSIVRDLLEETRKRRQS